MDLLRTPDDRFADLPGYPFAPHYIDIPIDAAGEGTATGRARPLPRRGTGRRRGGAAHARRAVVVVPLPPHDPGAHRRRPPLRRARPRRLRSLRQAQPQRPTTPTPGTSTGCAPRCSTPSTSPASPSSARTGAGLIGLRLVARAPGALRPRGGRQHVPAHRRPRRRRGVPRAGRSSPSEAPEFPIGAHHQRRLHHRPLPRGHRRLRRAVPRRHVQGRRPAVPRPGADHAPTTPPRLRTRPRGRRSSTSSDLLLTAFSDADPITKGGYAVFQKLVPGAQGRDHVTIEGGGHFLQEDRGPELAKVVADLIASTPVG